MSFDIEMDAQSKPGLDASSEQILDKTITKRDIEVPVASTDTPRSKLRMFAILTALFVSRPLPGSCSCFLDTKLIDPAVSIRCGTGCNDRLYCGPHDVS